MSTSALTENINIQHANGAPLRREVSRTQSLSVSPIDTFHSPPPLALWVMKNKRQTTGSLGASAGGAAPLTKLLKPFKEADIRILLLENVNQTGRDLLSQQGYQVESLKSSLPEDQLIEKIKCAASVRSALIYFVLICLQRYTCSRYPFENKADLPSPLPRQKPHCGWLLLHRHQPG